MTPKVFGLLVLAALIASFGLAISAKNMLILNEIKNVVSIEYRVSIVEHSGKDSTVYQLYPATHSLQTAVQYYQQRCDEVYEDELGSPDSVKVELWQDTPGGNVRLRHQLIQYGSAK